MKKIFIIYVFLLNTSLFSQGNGISFGFEINQTRFRQYSPTVTVPFENPHKADFGLGVSLSYFHFLSKKFIVLLKPQVVLIRTKSEVTSANQMNYLLLDAEIGYFLTQKNRINASVQYSYLAALLKAYKSPFANWSSFINNKHSINPTISFEHYWDKKWSSYLKFTYFTNDVFNSGALDSDNNVVGPVKVTPYTFSLGINYYYSFKPQKIKTRMSEGNAKRGK